MSTRTASDRRAHPGNNAVVRRAGLLHRAAALLVIALLALGLPARAEQVRSLQGMDFVALDGDRVLLTLTLSAPSPEPVVFTIDKPARLSLDLPDTSLALAERYRAWVRRTPMLIAVGAVIKPGNIPEIEQLLAAGAAAMNMLNALHMLGYGGMWVTGPNAYDATVNRLLGFEAPSRLVGFLTAGTPAPSTAPVPARPNRAAHVAEWMP